MAAPARVYADALSFARGATARALMDVALLGTALVEVEQPAGRLWQPPTTEQAEATRSPTGDELATTRAAPTPER